MRVKFGDRLAIDHLVDPDDVGTLFHGALDRLFHFRSDFRCVRRAGTKHNLKTRIHELNRADQVHDSFLTRDAANEEQIRFLRIDPVSLERIS